MGMDFARHDAMESKKTTLLGCLLLLAFLTYANTLANGFVYDDHSQIEQNPYVHAFRTIAKIFTMRSPSGNYYRPLMNLGFLFSFQLFGASPYGFHLINVLLHCAAVWLVYEVGIAMTSDQTLGLIAASVFAIHPIHTESVAWIAGVVDIEMTIFYLAAFWLFLRLERAKGRTIWIQMAMLGSFLLAALSKEPAMTLPALSTIYEHFYRADRNSTTWNQKLARYGGFWAIGFAYLGVRLLVLGGFAPVSFHRDVSWREAAFIAVGWIGQYAAKLLWPVPLTVFYAIQRNTSFLNSHLLLGAAVLMAAATSVVYEWKRGRIYPFWLLWILFTLAPVLNVRWLPMDVFAERFLYLPSVGFSWLVAGVALWLWRKSGVAAERRWALVFAAGLLALLASGEIMARNRDWKDDYSLALRTVQTNPDNANMRSDVAMAEWRAGKRDEALRQWHLALAYRPDSLQALNDLGFAMIEEKKYDEAIPYLQKANELSSRFAAPHVHLAHAYVALGKTGEAEVEFRRAVEISPMDPFARNALGRFYLQSGRLQNAETEFRASVAIVPDLDGWSGLAETYSLQDNPDQAVDAWRHVVAIEPFDSHAHLMLGRIYLAKGLLSEAAKEFDQCLYTDPHNAEALAAIHKLLPQGSFAR
jgi:tetratricopeptide (TPR) repeat protein